MLDGNTLVEEIKTRIDIVEIVSNYVSLKRKGKNYVGLCPFHSEKTPSFTVNPENQMFYCFGCGIGGDVFNFIMQKEGLNFKETLEFLAEKAGIEVSAFSLSAKEVREKNEHNLIIQALKIAMKFYQFSLTRTQGGKNALGYLQKRGLNKQTIDHFMIGFAPNSLDSMYRTLIGKGISQEILEKAGLISKGKNGRSYFDRFRNRIMFPIQNYQGIVVGFGGRVLDQSLPKYLNSPETAVFNKRTILYGLSQSKDAIRRYDQAVILEGYMDVVAAHQFGIKNAVASLGTSLTTEQGKLLSRYTKNVVIAYDGDAAGEAATLRGLEILRGLGFRVNIARLPRGKDPDDLLRTDGPESFTEIISTAQPLILYQLENIIKEMELSPRGKAEAAEKFFAVLSNVKSTLEINEYLRLFSEELQVHEETLRSEFGKFLQQRKNQGHRNAVTRNNIQVNKFFLKENAGVNKAEREVLRHLLYQKISNKDLINRINEEVFLNRYHRDIYYAYQQNLKAMDNNLQNIFSSLNYEESKNILLSILVEGKEREFGEDMLIDCLEKIRNYQLDQEVNFIDQQIISAQQKNDVVSLNELLKKRHNLIKQRKDTNIHDI
jgi:DNA primase